MIALVLAAVLGLGPAVPDRAADLHQRAVAAYRDADWSAARALWTAALDADPDGDEIDRAAVLYDLGNVAWRQDRGLEAVGWYTAALRLAPRHADARANLELCRSELGLEPDDRGDLDATVRRALLVLTLAEAEWLVLGVLCVLAGAFGYEALRGGVAGRRAVLVAVALVVAALVPWVSAVRAAGRDPMMVVADGGAGLRSEPRAEAALVRHLDPAEVAERVDAVPGWVRLRLADGERGWVPAGELFALAR